MGVYLIGNKCEIFDPVLKIEFIRIDYQQIPFIGCDPILIMTVQPLKVVQLDALLVITASFLDLGHQVRHTAAQVDQQVRRTYHGHHQIEELHVGIVIAPAEIALLEIVRNEDMYTFKKGAVLHYDIL